MADDKNIILEKLIAAAKEKGSMSSKEMLDALDELDIDVDAVEKLYEKLEANGIKIISCYCTVRHTLIHS